MTSDHVFNVLIIATIVNSLNTPTCVYIMLGYVNII